MALLFVVALLLMSMAPAAGAQRPASPPPSGNRIVAHDGDVVVVDHDAPLRVVRRREAQVRVLFNADERWLAVLVDDAASGPPDGRVDWTYHYKEVRGAWPLESRWEGATTIEEYSITPPGRPSGSLGISTPQGLVQMLGLDQEFRDRDAVAVLSYGGGGFGGATTLDFDAAERRVITAGTPAGGVQPEPGGAVRVGGTLRPPMKIGDVRPMMPEEAARLGIRGIVIMEVTIDVDGAVKDARVLRSIPMLDEAALAAVRQWRYEPTTIDGRAVPVIMTVSVQFR